MWRSYSEHHSLLSPRLVYYSSPLFIQLSRKLLFFSRHEFSRKKLFPDNEQTSLFTATYPPRPMHTHAHTRLFLHEPRSCFRQRCEASPRISPFTSSSTPQQYHESNAFIFTSSLHSLLRFFAPAALSPQKGLVYLLLSLQTGLVRRLPFHLLNCVWIKTALVLHRKKRKALLTKLLMSRKLKPNVLERKQTSMETVSQP